MFRIFVVCCAFVIFVSGTAALAATNTFPEDGNVGIGTTSPVKILDVYSTAAAYAQLKGSVAALELNHTTANLSSSVNFRENGVDKFIIGTGVYSADVTRFDIGDNARSFVSVKNNGNVGIGTTTPGPKLSIQGTSTYNSSNWGMVSDVAIRSSKMSDSLYHSILQLVSIRQSLSTGSAANGYLGFSTIDDSNTIGMLDAGRIAIVNENGVWRNSPTALSFWTNPGGTDDTVAAVERMRISSTGNVGIGITNPQTKLAVNGVITAKEVTVSVNGWWPDFVFDENHPLPKLEELEAQIKEHKHLPGIPSAKTIEKEGISLADMAARQMQKIEELSLYVIDLKKNNDLQQQTIDELNRRLETLENK